MNSYDVRVTTKLQDVFMFSKIAALGVVILAGLVAIYQGVNDNFHTDKVWNNTPSDPGKIAVSFYSGIFSYCGWWATSFSPSTRSLFVLIDADFGMQSPNNKSLLAASLA